LLVARWKTLSSRLALNHPWFRVREDTVELPNGKVLDDYTVWLDGDVAMVVPITAQGQFVMVRQYKHGAGDLVIEFPAGYVNPNEPPIEAARRELAEETGYRAGTLKKIGHLVHNPTKAVGTIHLYLADCLPPQPDAPSFDENEDIELLRLSFAEISHLVERGKISSSGSIAAFYLACRRLGLLRAGWPNGGPAGLE
jgi:ADP-ribose pyrophosphatase